MKKGKRNLLWTSSERPACKFCHFLQRASLPAVATHKLSQGQSVYFTSCSSPEFRGSDVAIRTSRAVPDFPPSLSFPDTISSRHLESCAAKRSGQEDAVTAGCNRSLIAVPTALNLTKCLFNTHTHTVFLLVGRSRDRSAVVSLGIFFRGYRRNHVPWGRLSL